MKKTYSLLICLLIFNLTNTEAKKKFSVLNKTTIDNPVIADNIIWKADTILITQNITIPDSVTLTISSGTNIEFAGPYKIVVNGALRAEGTPNDSIHFHSENKEEGWRGIQFLDDNNYKQTKDSSILRYCSISDIISNNSVKNNIYLDHYSKVTFSNCSITNNNCRYGVLRCTSEANATINNCNISLNGGIAIYCYNASPTITTNYILRNGLKSTPELGTGIMLENSKAIILNNIIAFNESSSSGTGIAALHDSNPKIVNNNICFNTATGSNGVGSGVFFDNGSYSTLTNCILWGNSSWLESYQFTFVSGTQKPKLKYCVVEDGKDGIRNYTQNSGLVLDDIYINCIEEPPLFEDAQHLNFNFRPSSVCINTGTSDTTGLVIPEFDILGNPRIAWSQIDIGAIEFQQTPQNKEPVLKDISRLDMLPNSFVEMKIRFVDLDKNDEHTFTVSSNNANVKIENLNQDLPFPTYTIKSLEDWTGSADITVTINDNSEASNATDSYTFTVYVNEHACGNISGKTIWDRDSIKVECDLTISEDGELSIKEGTIVEFLDYTGITVNGKILAFGTKASPIQFITKDTLDFDLNAFEIGWKGLYFLENAQDTSILRYCRFKYASTSDYFKNDKDIDGAAIYMNKYKKLIIENCLFKRNKSYQDGGAIYSSFSDVNISNSKFENNVADKGGAIAVSHSKIKLISDTIYSNITREDGAGLHISNSDFVSKNCIITNNYTHHQGYETSLTISSGTCVLYNNIICNNSGGVLLSGCSANIYNSTIYHNKNYSISISQCYPKVYNSILSGTIECAWGYPTLNYSILDKEFLNGENNLVVDPGFINPSSGTGEKYDALYANWDLKASSYAINQGDPATNISEFPFDLLNNSRMYGDRIDIGSFEFQNPPQNRQPTISEANDLTAVPSSITELTMSYWDPDTIDSHSIEIISDNKNVVIENVTNVSTVISFNVHCMNNWEGAANITVKVTDSSKSENSSNSKTFTVNATNSVCGHIKHNTIWAAKEINVTCNTILDDNVTLKIEPGVTMNFDADITFEIVGTLIASGNKKDSITFTSKNIESKWGGIMIKNGFYAYGHASDIMNDNDTTRLSFCKLENVNGQGFFIDGYSKVKIENSRFHNINGPTIHLHESSPLIKNNVIENNTTSSSESGTIWIARYSSPQIINNIIRNNRAVFGGGICCDYYCPAAIIGNLLYGNSAISGGGIYCSQSNSVIYNNTIAANSASNGGGIYGLYSRPQIINTIIWENDAKNKGSQIWFSDYAPNISHCFMSDTEKDVNIVGQFNIPELVFSENPEFEQASELYELSTNSPCINTGSTNIADEFFPQFDLLGNERQVDSLDIGAFEFQGEPSDLPPLYFSLNPKSISENKPINTAIGRFNVIDPNVDDTHTYKLIAGDGENDKNNDEFITISDSLKSNKTFDFEVEDDKKIFIEVQDSKGNTLSKAFTIEIRNIFETPVLRHPLPDLLAHVDSFFYFEIPDTTFLFENSNYKSYNASVLGSETWPEWLSFKTQTGEFRGTPSTEGDYDILVRAINSYAMSVPDTLRLKVISDTYTNIDKIDTYNLKIYPNPASERIAISSSSLIHTLTIYDISGEIIYINNNVHKYEMKLNVANLTRGVYFVSINKNKNYKSRKIILK